ncbi:hypothetical protein MJO28_017546 [Puccinia striiformis f. sp. tritici]|nr:hypothetical protein MJO28_017546 [Puccinia striiformis f. sp. tritici]
MITLKSCTFVSEEPARAGKNLFKILDANPWNTILPQPKPLYSPILDIYTPTPQGDLPDAASWLVFEGTVHASKTKPNLLVHSHSSSYHHTIPYSHHSLPYPRLSGLLKLDSDNGIKTAIDPDNPNSCLFSLTTAPKLNDDALSTLKKDDLIYLTADVVHYLNNVIHLKVRFFENLDSNRP